MPPITTRKRQTRTLTFAIDEAGDGADVALCLHGFPESRFSWRYQLPFLADRGWHAVAPDLRGYGETDRPSAVAAYRIEHLVDDAAAMFDALGARRRLLGGHDWGAVIAWAFAIRRTQPLDGLVIMNVPHPAVFQHVLRRSPRQLARSWYVAFSSNCHTCQNRRCGRAAHGQMFRSMAVDKAAFPDEILAHYQAHALRPGAMTAMLNYYRANFAALVRQTEPACVETPTLMIWGEEDAALGVELTEGYAPYVADFTLRRLSGVSHWVQQEAPDRVNAALDEWLTERRIAPGA